MIYLQVHLTLPSWLEDMQLHARNYPDDSARMALAIELARRNVDMQTGGPFGAALFDESGRVLGIGVNRVVSMNCSVAHAEMMAFMTAQARTQQLRLNQTGTRVTLATSAQPCSMCYGASIWAGIDRLLVGARASDVESLAGFDEGPLPTDWIGALQQRGIEVQRDLQREAACAVLREYGSGGGKRY